MQSSDLRVWKELHRLCARAAFPFFLFVRELIKIVSDVDGNTLRSLLLKVAARGAYTGAFTGEDSLLSSLLLVPHYSSRPLPYAAKTGINRPCCSPRFPWDSLSQREKGEESYFFRVVEGKKEKKKGEERASERERKESRGKDCLHFPRSPFSLAKGGNSGGRK